MKKIITSSSISSPGFFYTGVLLCSLLVSSWTFSQDLTGVWTGFLQIGNNKVPYELMVSGENDKLSGYSLLVFTFNGVENVGIKTMELKVRRASVSIEDGDLVYDNYSTPSRRVKLYGNLAWVGRDSNMTLSGTLSTRSLDMRALTENSFKGTILLHKKKSLARSRLLEKLNEMNLLNHAPVSNSLPDAIVDPIAENSGTKRKRQVIKPGERGSPKIENVNLPDSSGISSPGNSVRNTIPIQTIFFKSDSLKISLFDNGEVDGDTVSLILDGRTILSRQGLTTQAITTIIPIAGLGDSLQLVMQAINLGRIPPNTGLLILEDGNEKYYIRFSADLKNNPAIILRRKR